MAKMTMKRVAITIISCLLSLSAEATVDAAIAAAIRQAQAERDSPQADSLGASIWQAADRGDNAAIERFLAEGDNIDARFPGGTAPQAVPGGTPLLFALRKKRLATAEFLLDRGADPNGTTSDGFSALHYAFWAGLADDKSSSGYDGRFLRLLLDRGAAIDARAPHRDSVLMLIGGYSPAQPDALRTLLAYRLDVNRRQPPKCETVFYRLVSETRGLSAAKEQALKLLLTAGANPDANLAGNGYYGVGGGKDGWSYPHYRTPLLRAANFHSYADFGTSGYRADLAATAELVRFLLDNGANPRRGGIGGPHDSDPECLDIPDGQPGSSGTAAPEWVGFPFTRANPALSELLGRTAIHRESFDRVVAAAQPIQSGEIGFPAVHDMLSSYNHLKYYLSRDKDSPADAERYRATRVLKENLEHGLRSVLRLGGRVNPAFVRLSTETGWRDLWETGFSPAYGGVKYLPLYEHEMPDDLYLAFLEAGASPAIRRDKGGVSGADVSVIQYLIRRNAASKLALIGGHLGLLERLPTWCGRTVNEIAEELAARSAARSTDVSFGEADREARKILRTLLRNPACMGAMARQEREPLLRTISRFADTSRQ